MAKKTSPMHSPAGAHMYQPLASNPHLSAEYQVRKTLFDAQPPLVQRFLEAQARQVTDAIVRNQPQLRFSLPDRVVVVEDVKGEKQPQVNVPVEYREQMIGGVIDRITRTDVRTVLRTRLTELEETDVKAVSVSAQLFRHALATYLVQNMLPSGKTVHYIAAEGEEIPTIPEPVEKNHESAITASTDAIAEEGKSETNRGELLVPYVPAARRFYLPQWVSFDDEYHMLVKSVNEAEANIGSMQQFISILHMAVSIAPYLVFDPDYQQKRYGMLGQLINQGRALAFYEVHEMIHTIKKRAAAHDLNRGLSLSVPYFDDQTLNMHMHDFVVIPAGRIMFVSAFVVQAVQEEQVKVAQDTRLSPSTRKYLLEELTMFEQAFHRPGKTQA